MRLFDYVIAAEKRHRMIIGPSEAQKVLSGEVKKALTDEMFTVYNIVQRILPDVQHIVIDGVADYLNDKFTKNGKFEHPNHWSNLIAPFRDFWVEHKTKDPHSNGHRYLGGIVLISDGDTEQSLKMSGGRSAGCECWQLNMFINHVSDPEETAGLFYSTSVIWVDKATHESNGQLAHMIQSSSGLTIEALNQDEMVKNIHKTFWMYVLTAIAFINCKNVTMSDVVTPLGVRKKRERAGKHVPLTYKVLEITSIKNEIDRRRIEPGNIGKSPFEIAMHVCRAHLKTYTDEHPLFGKYTGTYLWSPQVRGSKAVGEVKKTYKVVTDEK